MIELCYAVSVKSTGKEVFRDCGKFENMDDFYSYMNFRYGYTSRDYSFFISGREISQ